MSLRELAEQDLAVTLTSGLDFGCEFSICQIGTSDWISEDINGDPLRGQFHRITTMKNPQNNLRQHVPRSSLTARISTLPFPIVENMPVKVLDINGTEIAGVCKNLEPDFTLGFITVQIEKVPDAKTNPGSITRRRGYE